MSPHTDEIQKRLEQERAAQLRAQRRREQVIVIVLFVTGAAGILFILFRGG